MDNNFRNRIKEYCYLTMGDITLCEEEKIFYRDLNNEIKNLCTVLPEAVKSEALIILMNYGRISPGEPFDFFANFYKTLWTVIFHTMRSKECVREIRDDEYNNALKAHAMSMLLHSLDDHLHDKELPVSHMYLLIRTEAWIRMNDGIASLSKGFDEGLKIKERLVNNYYKGVCYLSEPSTLEEYCNQFVEQMGIWIIVPVILSMKLISNNDFTSDIRNSFESFGIAWRIVDDINDIENDIDGGIHNAVYIELPEDGKIIWDKIADENESTNRESEKEKLFEIIIKNDIPDRLLLKACDEINKAVKLAEYWELIGFAGQYNELIQPIKGRLKDKL